MAWLALGALLMLLAVPAGRGKDAVGMDGLGFAAIAAFAVSAWLALPVYSEAKVAAIALAWSAALGAALYFARGRALPGAARWTSAALGTASMLFASLGPADGLF